MQLPVSQSQRMKGFVSEAQLLLFQGLSGAPVLQRSLVPHHLRSLRTVPASVADFQICSNTAAGHRKGQPPPHHPDLLQLSAQLPDNSVLSVSPGSQLGVSKSTSNAIRLFPLWVPSSQGWHAEIRVRVWWLLPHFRCIIHHLFHLGTWTPESHNNQKWARRLITARVQCDVLTYPPPVATVINAAGLHEFSLKQNCEIVPKMSNNRILIPGGRIFYYRVKE